MGSRVSILRHALHRSLKGDMLALVICVHENGEETHWYQEWTCTAMNPTDHLKYESTGSRLWCISAIEKFENS